MKHHRLPIIAAAVCAVVMLMSCSAAKDTVQEAAALKRSAGGARSYKAVANTAADAPELQSTGPVIERKLIKEGYLRFETADIQKTRHTIETLTEKYGAYISQEDEQSAETRIYQNITLKVPKEHFDSFLTDLTDGVKKIDEKSIGIQDVTEEFIDIDARLKVKKETEAGYLRLLDKAQNVKDILDIQNEIQNLRSDIESIEGRLRYLENSVNFSTIRMRMYQNITPPADASSFFEPIWDAVKGGLVLFGKLCIALLYGWVFIVLAAALCFIVIKVWKRKKGKGAEK